MVNAQGIHHSGMRIRAHYRIGIGLKPVAVRHRTDDPREVFQVHLVADARVWWNDFEILKRRLPPAQERVALDVTLKLQLRIQAERVDVSKIIHLHRMVDDQLGREQRIDSLRVPAHALHGFTHGGEIDDCGYACEILQEDSRRHECDLFFRSTGPPVGKRADVLSMDEAAILAAQEILQKDAQ